MIIWKSTELSNRAEKYGAKQREQKKSKQNRNKKTEMRMESNKIERKVKDRAEQKKCRCGKNRHAPEHQSKTT